MQQLMEIVLKSRALHSVTKD